MSENFEKLISVSSSPFNQEKAKLTFELVELAGNFKNELQLLLNKKNGFYAFESALRVFPIQSCEYSFGLSEWNSDSLWRHEYSSSSDGCLFFGEDIFGNQFCIKNNSVCVFDPETGELEEISSSIEGWAKKILEDYNLWTGHNLAHEWQKNNGILPNNMRLIPKIPFVCGGQFQVDNLFPIEVVSGMKSRANLAKQILNISDGEQIEFKIVE